MSPFQSPEVSVIIPIYNGSNYLNDAVNSIRMQSFTNWEMLLLDDGSQDGSFELAEYLSHTDSRIHVNHHEKNLGLATTMNHLVKLAKGRYIAVQEQDDVSCPDRLWKEYEVLTKKKDVGCVSGIAAWLNDEGLVFALFPGILAARKQQYPHDFTEMVKFLYIDQCKVVNAACMFRQELISKIDGPFDENARMSIDWQYFLHLAHFTKFWGIPEVLVRMRRGRSHNSLTKKKELQFYEARRCINLIYKQYSHNPNSPINRSLYNKAMSTELYLEARTFGKLPGGLRILHALMYNPANHLAYDTILSFIRRKIVMNR